MQPVSAVSWLAKCGLGAATLLLACGLVTAWLGNEPQLPSVTTRDGTLITLSRYVREPIPEIVMVGSSLGFRLKEEYFATPRLRNLALAGGSPLTGLEIVLNQPALPKIVLVEANILTRPADTALVEKYSRSGNAEPLFLRPVRTAVAAYEGWLHAPLSHAQAALALDRLLQGPPSDFDNRIYLDRALREFNSEYPTVDALANATRMQQLIAAIERRGVRVRLYELPYYETLEGARWATIPREIVHAKFPDPDQWLRIEFTRSELRWPDGAHLDERSALIVAQSIDRMLASLPEPR